MTMPGFTAEAGLCRVHDRYDRRRRAAGAATTAAVVPQKIECDFIVHCKDGKRYVKFDCPDGSGGEYEVGVCPRPWSLWKPVTWWRRHLWQVYDG